MNIIEPNNNFDFSKLSLANPLPIQGGSYFTKIMCEDKPLYIQTPKSLTKQGFVKSGKKIYTDLMFNNNDTIFIHWLENLEIRCQELIYEKGTEWFETTLEKSDIETAFTSPIKLFKSGKFFLLRVNVKQNIKIYNERDENVSSDDVKLDTNIISILEIQGIKFTSRNFQVEIELKQSMIVSPDPFLDTCFIKKPLTTTNIIKTNDVYTNASIQKNTCVAPEISIIDNIDKNESTNIENKEEQNHLSEMTSDILDMTDTNVETAFVDNAELESINVPTNLATNSELMEIDINELENESDMITLKKPNEVYYQIYKNAREKAKQAKKDAILAFLEAKNIKKTYMLDDINDSDSDIDNCEFSENEYL